MKTLKTLIIILVTSGYLSGISWAGERAVLGRISKYQCGYHRQQSEYKYRGISGTRYKYDLSRGSDRLRYEMDLDSQLKDKVYGFLKPGVEIDRAQNQYGGGIKP